MQAREAIITQEISRLLVQGGRVQQSAIRVRFLQWRESGEYRQVRGRWHKVTDTLIAYNFISH
jgi:hypothetical protein